VELHELLVVFRDRAGDLFGQSLRQRAAQILARFLDTLVAGEFFGHRSILPSISPLSADDLARRAR